MLALTTIGHLGQWLRFPATAPMSTLLSKTAASETAEHDPCTGKRLHIFENRTACLSPLRNL